MNSYFANSSVVFLASLASLALSACGRDLVVGKEVPELAASGGASSSDGGSSQEEPRGTGAVPSRDLGVPDNDGCDLEETDSEAARRQWQEQESDWQQLAGTEWTGHVEHGPQIRLMVSEEGSASVRFGTAELAPPPTDPELGWACEPQPGETYNGGPILTCTQGSEEGVLYQAAGAIVSATRVSFRTVNSQPWDEWCAMQTPLVYPNTCLYSATDPEMGLYTRDEPEGCGYIDYDGERTPRDCAWLRLASASCACNASECFADFREFHQREYDFSIVEAGAALEGSYLESEGELVSVRLTLVDPEHP